MSPRRRRAGLLLAVALAGAASLLPACGDDDGQSPQAQLAERIVDDWGSLGRGFEVNAECIHDVAARLSDADAEAVLAANDAQVGNATDNPAYAALEDEFKACGSISGQDTPSTEGSPTSSVPGQ